MNRQSNCLLITDNRTIECRARRSYAHFVHFVRSLARSRASAAESSRVIIIIIIICVDVVVVVADQLRARDD